MTQDSQTLTADEALDALECLHTYALKTAATDSFYETHNQEMNEHMRVVRDVLASLPPPPVSGEADAEITRLTSQLEQAERVIAPFAEFVDCLDEELPDDEEYNTELGLEGYHSLTCGNFRLASQWIKDRQEKQALAELHTEEKHFGLE